ncbi:MAG TPA: radical SAM protein [Candidatus Hydrogenedentes bacterium]|nr:radical SAM protein [Candidatus Hydrogenedentota bacterium]
MTEQQPQRPKIVFLNLPHRASVVRRYMCSHTVPMFFFPPHELLQLATCAREWNGADIRFLDAIADRSDEASVHASIERERPDGLVSIVGIETISDDLACLDRIKEAFPTLTCTIFGFYPTNFPQLILERSRVDFILRGEPEATLSTLLQALDAGQPTDGIVGLAGRRPDGSIFANAPERILDFDELPFPDYSILDVRKYEEGLLGGPLGAIFTARGCPFRCNFCTTTYGRKLVLKRPKTVVAEVKSLVAAGVRLVRFLDDTFTANKARVITICREIIAQGIRVRWACLARVDTLDAEMLAWMKQAGCVRVVVGVESYSPKILDYLDKGVDPATCNAQLALIRKARIESVGFFLVGAPVETDQDFQETLRGALASPLDLIGVNILTPYAGTPFFDKVKDDLVFSLIPYECRYKDESIGVTAMKRERILYMRFYLRPAAIVRQLRYFFAFPLRTTRLLLMVLRYQTKQFRSHERPDVF